MHVSAEMEEGEEAQLPEEADAEMEEEYVSPRETTRDDASSCSESDYRTLLASPIRAVQDGKFLWLLYRMHASLLAHALSCSYTRLNCSGSPSRAVQDGP